MHFLAVASLGHAKKSGALSLADSPGSVRDVVWSITQRYLIYMPMTRLPWVIMGINVKAQHPPKTYTPGLSKVGIP
jgi:hypothetical protein